ncbi:DUF5719 family protein [Streptomyces griseocarneus]|uniref:DUF5719 family protein n=1 Tax=Streptomyces griseocarneus TaxID=51201 RepID=UPI00167C4DFC|nr:DUF5719 family protein [Streptomyces griseocarneus]MBZ6476003.1 DUF5719 family protein [Streptomyces griseocarneus]GHG77069.1 hypothetical protein GCM10018779_55740 [Streptomyces griseocarneus]
MKHTTLSLFAATAALAVVTGVAALNPPSDGAGTGAGTGSSRLPVQRSTLLCPAPVSSDASETTYAAFTPPGTDGPRTSPADLLPAAGPARADAVKETRKDARRQGASGRDAGRPVLSLREPGRPVTVTTDRADAPALLGTADGALAPGWTAQQTTTVASGGGRGLHGVACAAPDTSFWFPGASTAKGRQDYVHLTNPDSAAAVVDLELYGRDGRIGTPAEDGVNVPPRSTVPVLLSSLTDAAHESLTLHVAARSGRVGAAVRTTDDALGGDWLPPSADASPAVVLPGIPADATSVRLVAFAPGSRDADLRLRLAGPDGPITPAGHESLHLRSGMTEAVDLGDVTRGEAGSLLLTAERGSAPVVAALRVTRGKGEGRETAFIPATPAVGARATVADNRLQGGVLSLTAPREAARVRVTASAGSGGGAPVSRIYTVGAGSTLAVEPPRPRGGKGVYALTVEKVSGGPVHASRMLALPRDGVPMFTIQPVADDRSTVVVPEVEQDLSVLND